jgi:SAM-dependent methyltransferase
LTPERSAQELAFLKDQLAFQPGQRLLDLCCGHGRLSNPLASEGLLVTGLDASEYFIERAREEAKQEDLNCEYLVGDMRELPWENRFDYVINWFTAFGYFREDKTNRAVLAEVLKVLKPGGQLAIETQYLPQLLRNFRETYTVRRDGNSMIDEPRFNFTTSHTEVTRTVHRDGKTRTTAFWVRQLMPVELYQWLLDAGFSKVELLDEKGLALNWDSKRFIAIATK